MSLIEILEKLRLNPNEIEFGEIIGTIDDYYEFRPISFINGDMTNDAGKNIGSCKLFYFGLLQQLTKDEMLQCFGSYYRIDVLLHPDGDDHPNIRNFMKYGWEGIQYDGIPLNPKRGKE